MKHGTPVVPPNSLTSSDILSFQNILKHRQIHKYIYIYIHYEFVCALECSGN